MSPQERPGLNQLSSSATKQVHKMINAPSNACIRNVLIVLIWLTAS